MRPSRPVDRRAFLKAGGLALAATALGAAKPPVKPTPVPPGEKMAEGIGPVEDLMREHGVLLRVLLIYEESARRIETGTALPAGVVAGAAGIVRSFVEEYHEKLEEDHVFPRFAEMDALSDLVKVLAGQHAAGRRVTDGISRLAAGGGPGTGLLLAGLLRRFIRMCRPHAACEDTVLFPEFRRIMPPQEYRALGDRFEAMEDRLFGGGGFFKVLGRVAEIETRLGIAELAQFTPDAV